MYIKKIDYKKDVYTKFKFCINNLKIHYICIYSRRDGANKIHF